jgi:hypothetical protein
MVWEMNGNQVVGTTTIGMPGTDWSVVGTGDFEGNGNTDILLQRTQNGVPNTGDLWLWQMNGTQLANSVEIGDPGPGWQVANLGDYNGDGKTDILFQGDSTQGNLGPVMVWEMNGNQIASSSTIGSPGGAWVVLPHNTG